MAHHLSAPLASMYLADFGADVVKVETLEGEDWRRWGRPSPAGMSQLFLAVNRNKRSLSLDYRGVNPPRMTVYGAYATKDGFITIAVLAERLWERLCRVLGLDRVLTDPRYTPWPNLVARQAELRGEVEACFKTRTTDEWLALLIPAGVPAGRVSWGAEVFAHRQLNLNGAIMRVRHPKAGPMRTMGFPLRLAAPPARLRRGAPALGADTRAVLRELGYPSREIARLIQANAVHCV